MHRYLIVFFLFLSFTHFAQLTEKYTSNYVEYEKALDLFKKEQYSASRNSFRKYIDNITDKNDPSYTKSLYYEAMAALELQQNDAVQLTQNFVKNYPENNYKGQLFTKMGLYFFSKKDYKTTIEWFKKLERKDYPKENKDEFYFKMGYAYFQLNKYTDARNAFYEIRNNKGQYGITAMYYYSHISYQDKSYQTALDGFLKIQNEPKFNGIVPYYICQIYYLQGKYTEVTQFAKSMSDSVIKANQKHIQLVVGDSYYKIGKYDEAAVYLEHYNRMGKTSRQEDYQLAYSYFQAGSYDKAVKYFDKIAQTKDELGQISLYHIAEAYLKKGDQKAARKAFEIAATIDINKKTQEDALYNFAVISYKLDNNPYNEALKALSLFLTKFPESERKNEVSEYLVNVYSQTNNYEFALKSLDKFAKLDIKLSTAYQTIAFNRGVELFLNKNYFKSIDAFELVDKYPIDLNISARAKYWVSEAYFLAGNYSKAIEGFKNFLGFHNTYLSDLRMDAYYNLGYAYHHKTEYSEEIEAFKMFLQEAKDKGKKEKILDATLRLADAYYLTNANDLAIRNYQTIFNEKMGKEDQALYYIAQTYGFKKDYDSKIQYLDNLIATYPNSNYYQPSLIQLGLAYRTQVQDDKALACFEKIVAEFPENIMVKDAWIEMADIYLKKQNFEQAESYFKKVLEKYNTDRNSCADAVKGLVNVYKAWQKPELVEPIFTTYTCAEFSKDEQEDIYYNSAIDPYLDSNYTKAIPSIHKYLTKYQNSGRYSTEMKAYLANAYYQLKNEDSAMVVYKELLDGPTTEFSELAALRVSRNYYNSKKYEEALTYYTKLENITSRPDIMYNTALGLMRCHFILKHWSNATMYANKVLESSKNKDTKAQNLIQTEAEFAAGMSNYNIGKFNEARKSLLWIIANNNTKIAGEARYAMAEMSFQEKNYTKADEEIQQIFTMKPTQNYWIAKGFILQSKIYLEKNDLFQAEQSVNSIIEHYTNKEDGIITEAQQQLETILQLKNKPKLEEVTPQTLPVEEIEIDESLEEELIEEPQIEIQPDSEN